MSFRSGGHSRKPSLSIERLEDRKMMAGDIRADLVNGTIFLNESGGTGDQAVQVSQLDNGRIRVEGQVAADGHKTKINGKDFVDFFAATPFSRLDLKANLGGGQDFVTVRDAKLGTVEILTADTFGNGANDADVVRLERVRTTGAVNINTGAGADVVGVYFSTIGNSTGADDLNITSGFAGLPGQSDVDGVYIQSTTVFGATRVNTGASDDYVSVQFSNFGNEEVDFVVIDAGAGADTVELGMPNRQGQISGPVQLAGSLTVLGDSFTNSDAESGDDVVRMHSVYSAFDIAVNLRTGNDRLEATDLAARFIALHGEKGNDTMTLVEADALETLFALMGEGDDLLDMAGCRPHLLAIDGGAGANDRLLTFDMTNVPTNKTGFESVNGVRQPMKRVAATGVLAVR
jgi:hypothetical protein